MEDSCGPFALVLNHPSLGTKVYRREEAEIGVENAEDNKVRCAKIGRFVRASRFISSGSCKILSRKSVRNSISSLLKVSITLVLRATPHTAHPAAPGGVRARLVQDGGDSAVR